MENYNRTGSDNAREARVSNPFTREGLVRVTPNDFPRLFANKPDLLRKTQEGTRLYAIKLTRENPNWIKIDGLMEKKPSFSELPQFAFKTSYYPSTEIVEVSQDKRMELDREGKTWEGYAELTLNKKELRPDLNAEEKKLASGAANLSDYLAIQLATGELINPDTGKQFETVDELSEQLKKYDVPTKLQTISVRLLDLPKDKNVRKFIQKGWITEGALENYFRNIAIWNTLFSLSRVFSPHKKEANPIFPFITDPQEYQFLTRKTVPSDEVDKDFYRLEYLPYLVSAMYEYVLFIPDILPSGGVYPLSYIEEAAKKLVVLCRETIRQKREDYDPKEINRITTITRDKFLSLRNVLDEFRTNQNLWYKEEKKGIQVSEANVANLQSIMDEIRASGGKAPSHLYIKKRFEAKKGRI